MKPTRDLILLAVAALLATPSVLNAQTPVGPAFTYQGQLKEAGIPANGSYDFLFRLFDDPSTGTQVGGDLPIDDWPVADGLFTVQLDFGEDIFTGEALWLEVAVRPGDSGDPHTVLSPRQPLNATPYALYALGGPGSGGFWAANGDHIYNTNSGNVGIGTAYPGTTMHVVKTTGNTAILAESGGPGYQCAVEAFVESPEGNAIFAFNEGWTGNAYGIAAQTASPSGTAIYAWASNADLWDSSNIGVHGRSDGDNNAVGVYGEATNTNPDGTTYGVRGVSVEGTGVRGDNQYTGSFGVLGTQFEGVRGMGYGGGAGVRGIAGGWGPAGSFSISDDTNNQAAVKGHTNNPDGYAGYFTGGRNYFEGHVGIGTTSPASMLDVQSTEGTHGVMSEVPWIAVWAHRASTTGTWPAIHGECDSEAANGSAIRGIMTSTSPGSSSAAVRGINNGTGGLGIGVYGSQDGSGWGIYGYTPSGRGVYGLCPDGVGVRGDGAIGGYFEDSDGSGRAYVGYSNLGIEAYGDGAGGSFVDTDGSGSVTLAQGDFGVLAEGSAAGGYFWDSNGSGRAWLAATDAEEGNEFGVVGQGAFAGGLFEDTTSGTWCRVAYGTRSTDGNGAKSFVQNHPHEKDKVIVYTCLEGDEVATYTRGTGRLQNGVARVPLGETFKWGANPDIGLTAHLTPRGNCDGLYVEVLGTNEMIVRELRGGTSNVTFDYIVYGLRIGFEEVSIVQEKEREAYIPSVADHRALYERRPELREYNALERFKRMRAAVGQTEPLDLSASQALHDAIVEFDPAVHSLDDRRELEAPEPIEMGEDRPREQRPYRPELVDPKDTELAELRARVEVLEALVARLATPQNGGEQ